MEIATFGSIGLTVALAALAVEVIKKLLMDKIFPPKEKGLSKDERSLLYGIRDSIKDLKQVELKDLRLEIERIPVGAPGLSEAEHKALMDLMEMHDNKDQDGIPLWWLPRSWHSTLSESLKVSTEIAYNQKDLAKTLDSVVQVLERLVDRGRI